MAAIDITLSSEVLIAGMGLAATVVTAWLGSRTLRQIEARKQARDDARVAAGARRAARLVRAELIDIIAALEWCIENQEWWSDEDLQSDVWDVHRLTLAERVSDNSVWQSLAIHYSALRVLKQLSADDGFPEEPVREQLKAAEEAERLLRAYEEALETE